MNGYKKSNKKKQKNIDDADKCYCTFQVGLTYVNGLAILVLDCPKLD